jgi:hypothetical protein
MVLDGILPPSLTVEEIDSGQLAGFERSLKIFLTNCADDETCLFGDGDPENTLKQLLDELDVQPLPTDDGRMLSRAEAEGAILMALYSDSNWPFLENALAEAIAGVGSSLQIISDWYYGRDDEGTYSFSSDGAFNAVTCSDYPPLGLEEIIALTEEHSQDFPFFGPSFYYGELPCTYWPVTPKSVPKVIDTKGAPQIMVVGTTGDPATPYQWSQRLVDELDRSFLVTFEGEVHCAIEESSCVDSMYEQYLLNPDAGYVDIGCSKDVIAKSSVNAQSAETKPKRLNRRWYR